MKNKRMRSLILSTLLFTLCCPFHLHAQKVVQIERYGRAETEKIFIGEGIEYQLKDTKEWRYAVIEDINVEQNLIVLADRYLDPDKIAAFRYYRPISRNLGFQMMTFGVAWSGYALVGTALDRDPDTSYRLSDGIVTATSVAAGYGVMKLFKYKKIKFGKRKRLRLVDIRF
jgi:hypothetical protein